MWNKPALLAVLVLAACGGTPTGESDVPKAEDADQLFTPAGPVKLDVLFVVDNSASMCHEMHALGRSVDKFVAGLQGLPQLDLRVAALTLSTTFGNEWGALRPRNPPPACAEFRVWPCEGNQDCVDEHGAGWECESYALDQVHNMNGSVKTICTFNCSGDDACCVEFCHADECAGAPSCLESLCADAATQECTHECVGLGTGESGSRCNLLPDIADCPANVAGYLTSDNIHLFKCLVAPQDKGIYSVNRNQGLLAAWRALDPDGANGEQSAAFLRSEAYLLLVFVTDEDECSIAEDFCPPSFECDSDADCPFGTKCKLDKRFSQLTGKEKRLCCGSIKGDYHKICSLLGEYKGADHHQCVYDIDCADCETDDDCDYGWYCKQGKKCRPDIFSLTNIASYQATPGTPIFSLAPVADFFERFKNLKDEPNKVMIAAIVGDGMALNDDTAALISDKCMEDDSLKKCQFYALERAASPGCAGKPAGSGCEEFLEAKLDCIRECYVASKGDAQNSTVARNSYVCASDLGRADAGLRYIRLAEMFGPNGMVSNICSPEGMDKAMTDIAEMVVSVVK